jgi:signal transduction histidine kinase
MKHNKIKNQIKQFFNTLVNFFRARSISSQMIITIILIFSSFFLLQTILNIVFFKNYYTTQEFDRIHNLLIEYVTDMNKENSDYYDTMYDFTKKNNAYSVIVDGSYHPIRSSYTNYSIVLQDSSTNLNYRISVPNNDHDYTIGESIDASLTNYTNDLYYPIKLSNQGTIFYNSNNDCLDIECVTVSGTVAEINKPNNLNYFFNGNTIIDHELKKIQNGTIDLEEHSYFYDGKEGYWYRSTDGPITSMVFVHNLKTWNWIITVVPIVDTSDVVNIISNYNYYVYATAIVIIFLWSFRISGILSKPIKNIELVAREIAGLNFNVEAQEYNNKENISLSNSINLIATNLKTTLETLNFKNDELKELYEEQSTQVKLKKQLVSSISHELKTPLMIMQVTIQAILDGVIDDSEKEKELNNLLSEINKSSMMIQDMLQIYRLEDANTALQITEFDISKTTLRFLNEFESSFKKFDFIVETNIQDSIFVDADEKLIKRVISNFITNAIKYTSPQNKIYIEVSQNHNDVYFEVTNYGSKIDDEDLKKIWLPFYRGKIQNFQLKQSKGTGIGLYLVSEILKAHDAEFNIENTHSGVKAFFKLKKHK